MAISYQKTVGPTKVLLADMASLGGGPSVTILNNGTSTDVYIGGDENEFQGATTVGVNSGFRLAAGASMSLDMVGHEKVYGIVTTTTVTVHVFRSGT